MKPISIPQGGGAKSTSPAKIGVCLLLILAIAVGGVLKRMKDESGRLLNPGESAPMFIMKDQDNREHRLEDYHNRPVTLAFLPDLGADSVTQLRSINRAIKQFDTLGVKVFAVAEGTPANAKAVHDTEHLNFPILLDAKRATGGRYGVEEGNRTSYVVGGDGRVLLPIGMVNTAEHGQQLVELTECCLDKSPPAPSRLIGKRLPDFSLPRVSDGKRESLYGDNRQKATVLFVMSAECPCSGGYDGRIAALAQAYTAKGARFIALNSSANETVGEIAKRAKQSKYTFPVLKDAGNVIADRISAQVTPEVFVTDAKGVLRYHGRIDDNRNAAMVKSHDLRNALDFLLAGKSPLRADLPTFGCAIYRAKATSMESLLVKL